jgi:uncharacterized protein (TIGR02646 family)
MIRIVRGPLPEVVAADLAARTAEVGAAVDQKKRAQDLWKHTTFRRTVRPEIRAALGRMAVGLEGCMYCGNSLGTDIDHFEPVARNPLRTFDWLNHLLACSRCNSHQKRDQFPLDAHNRPLLIDPTAEDPFEHLLLSFSVGEYDGKTEKGRTTIKVCDLNNELLARGRAGAALDLQDLFRAWERADLRSDEERKVALVRRVQDRPFADVCQAMLRQADNDNADLLFQPGIAEILRRPDFQGALLR